METLKQTLICPCLSPCAVESRPLDRNAIQRSKEGSDDPWIAPTRSPAGRSPFPRAAPRFPVLHTRPKAHQTLPRGTILALHPEMLIQRPWSTGTTLRPPAALTALLRRSPQPRSDQFCRSKSQKAPKWLDMEINQEKTFDFLGNGTPAINQSRKSL
ncbi:hypothetical protein V6N13_064470 [Hibiscus sabdariffa]|uniref:Uncharacterized protein n=1 Tax=Hibiscus sabdariffa TaxID=183260 RepID=A0ABR2EAL8_9ROSI